MISRLIRLYLLFGLLLAGCGGTTSSAFTTHFPDNQPTLNSRIADSLPASRKSQKPNNRLAKPILAASTHAKEPELLLFDLTSRSVLWRHKARIDSRPEILDDAVVALVDGRLSAFDLTTGKALWRSPIEGREYLGATRGKGSIIYSISGMFDGDENVSVVTARDARTGDERWRHRVSGRLGRPAAVSGFVLVPWDRQKIAILNEATGNEVARLRSQDDLINWVMSDETGVYFGNQAIYRLTPKGYHGTKRSAPYLAQPFSGLPAEPSLWESAFVPQPGDRSALGRIRILFELEGSKTDEIRVADKSFYLLFYRYVFRLRADGTVVWCRVLVDDVIGSQSIRGGLITVAETGALHLLDAETGRVLFRTRIQAQLASVHIDAQGLTQTISRSAPPDDPIPSLREQLIRVANDPDNRLMLARGFAIRQLARLPIPEVTRDLLDLYAHSAVPPVLKQTIAQLLVSRRRGQEHLLDALLQHADFLTGTPSPALSLIVPALVEMQEKRAVPSLVHHLFDHATPIADLPIVISGIRQLGDASVIPLLKKFLQLYRSDSAFDGSEEILLATADALLHFGGPDERAFLQRLTESTTTLHPLATAIRSRLAPATSLRTEVAQTTPRKTKGKKRPNKRDRASINATFARHTDDLRECIMQEIGRNPELAQVRIAFIVNRDGTAHGFRFVPHNPQFVACLEPKVTRYRFPPARVSRELATYVIALRSKEKGIETDPNVQSGSVQGKPQPWWAWYQKRTAIQPRVPYIPGRSPWWLQPKSTDSQPPHDRQQATDPWWLPVEQ
jgi:outer membrane protein assembly factor BamB